LPNSEYARVSVRHGKCLRGGNTPYNELSQTDFGFADLPIIIDPHAYIRNKEREREREREKERGREEGRKSEGGGGRDVIPRVYEATPRNHPLAKTEY